MTGRSDFPGLIFELDRGRGSSYVIPISLISLGMISNDKWQLDVKRRTGIQNFRPG